MARTLNPVAHALRRDAFVEVAQRLIASKGYEQLSIADVLDELGASKGAFYHYFSSKQALLEAVVERIIKHAAATLEPVANDPGLPAIEKLHALFASLAQWKGERIDLMLELLKVWFSDDNIVVREQLRRGVTTRVTPLLATIVWQGKAEGVFTVSQPDGTAAVLGSLLQGANETASRFFLARQANAVTFEDVERWFAAYTEAFERILGVPVGSLRLTDEATLRRWFG